MVPPSLIAVAESLHSGHGTSSLSLSSEGLGAVVVSKNSDDCLFSGESYQELPMRTEFPFCACMHPRNIGTQSHSPNSTPPKTQKDGDFSCLALYLIKPRVQPDLSLLSVQANLFITCPLAQSALMALEIRQATETLISMPCSSPTSLLHCQRRGR